MTTIDTTSINTEFLQSIWNGTTGFVRVGALKEGVWDQKYLAWPGIEEVLNFYETKLSAGWDIYFNPTLYGSPDKENPLGSWVIWTDFDGNKPGMSGPPPSTWTEVPKYRVQTSSDVNVHVYWQLDQFYSHTTVELANRLRAYSLDADKSSWDFGQMLRVPNSLNHKTNPAQPVFLLPALDGTQPIQLREEELIELRDAEELQFTLLESNDVPKSSLTKIQTYLNMGEWNKDRSAALYHIACLCYEQGMSDDQAATVLWSADKEIIKKWSPRWNGEKLLQADIARLLKKTQHKTTEGLTFAGLRGVDPVIAQAQVDAQSFWDARPELQHILTYSRSRLAPPWAVLGCVLARVIASIEPNVMLPAIVGGRVSLNLFVGLVGGSSGGKGISNKVAHDCIAWPLDITTTGPGSGEGLIKVYKSMEKEEIVTHTNRALMVAEEIDTLSALTNRQASTLMPELRKAYMGEQLGFSYAARDKRIQLKQDEYRLCLTVGIQPLRAEQLLAEQDGGTPQRFIWMPTVDPMVPDDLPLTPEPLEWKIPVEYSMVEDVKGALFGGLKLFTTVEVQVCQKAQLVIRANRKTALRTGIDNLDGHSLLTQLKVATALGLLNGRLEVNEEDWDLATVLMHVSDSTRSSVIGEFQRAAVQKNLVRAKAEATRAVVIEEVKDDQARQNAAKNIKKWLNTLSEDEWMPKNQLRTKLKAGPTRDAFDEAMSQLINLGQVQSENYEYRGNQSVRYRMVAE